MNIIFEFLLYVGYCVRRLFCFILYNYDNNNRFYFYFKVLSLGVEVECGAEGGFISVEGFNLVI